MTQRILQLVNEIYEKLLKLTDSDLLNICEEESDSEEIIEDVIDTLDIVGKVSKFEP